MSKVVVLFEQPGMTYKEYDAICDELRKRNKLVNEDRVAHVSFERDEKFCVVDVWISEESMKKFVETALMPASMKLGLIPIQPVILPAHSWIGLAEEIILS